MDDETRRMIRVDVRGLSEPDAARAGELFLALRDLLLKFRAYPGPSSMVARALDGWIRLLGPFHGAGQPVVLADVGDRLALNGRIPADGDEAFEHAEHCRRFLASRGIANVAFLAGLDPGEMRRFVELLHAMPEGVERARGINDTLVARGAQHVVCNASFTTGDEATEAPLPRTPRLPAAHPDDTEQDATETLSMDHPPAVADDGDAAPAWTSARLDDVEVSLEPLLDGPDGPSIDPAELFASTRYRAFAAERGYRRLDAYLHRHVEQVIAGHDGRRRTDRLRACVERLSAAIEDIADGAERAIFRQRLAALLLELEPAPLAALLSEGDGDTRALREQTLKGLVHADRMAKRVIQDLAFRASKTDDSDRFLRIVEAMEWLVPGRIADGDLEPALAALKVIDHLRVSQHTPLNIRTRATQLLRWLCRPELVDRLLVVTVTGDAHTARRAREILLHLGPSAGDLLLAELKRSLNPEIRLAIVDIVAQLLSQEHVAGGTFTRSFRALLQEIEHAEDHPWYYVRNLLAVIRRIGDDRFLDWIARFLDNPDGRVRQEAIVACAELNTPGARRLLRSVADGIEITTADALDAVGSALLDHDDFDIVGFLTRVIDESTDLEVRLAAVQRLATFAEPEVVGTLARLLNRKRGLIGRRPHYPDELREAAALELRRRDTAEAERALADASLDPSEAVRRAASEPLLEPSRSSSWEG